MIEDYKLLNEWQLIFKKKRFFIWGAGEKGKELGKNMRMHTNKVSFVDKDRAKWGEYCGIKIHAPEEITVYKDECAIILSTNDLKIQDSILIEIQRMGLYSVDIYTWYAMWSVLFFMNNDDSVKTDYRNRVAKQSELMEIKNQQKMLEKMFMAQMVSKTVFVYQSKKVGSITVASSVNALGIFGFHVHNFRCIGTEKYFIREMIKKISGKVISIVREPIARQISLLWQYWGTTTKDYFYLVRENLDSLEKIESRFYAIPNGEDEFEWYLDEFKDILDINVYEYPFDREKGYSIIEKDGISLLLLKMEKMKELERVIGDFIGADDFKLMQANMAGEKKYKYAYQNYLENVKIPEYFYRYYYCNNEYMNHFYTEDEKNSFYQKWKDHIC